MTRARSFICLLTIAVLTPGVVTHTGVAAQQPVTQQPITPAGLAQIAALAQEKASRTPAERKIASRLLYAMKMARGEQVAPGVNLRPSTVRRDPAGRFEVDVTARTSSAALRATLVSNGANVLGAVLTARGSAASTARAFVAGDRLLALAARADITAIRPHQDYLLSGATRLLPKHQRRAAALSNGARLRTQPVTSALHTLLASAADRSDARRPGGSAPGRVQLSSVGSAASEGDVTHRANLARSAFGVDGTGIRIGVLSDGVASLAQSQASGDLGTVTVLPGQDGAGDEGTAMLEIIHDLAPGAELYFATGLPTVTQFAQNIRDLRTAGCDIIVDDLGYYVESPFQDGQTVGSSTNGGVVTQAVNDVTAAGALYFSSAGNEGNANDGTGGVWEGDFVPAATPPALAGAGPAHDFGSGQNSNLVTGGGSQMVTLHWSDPLGSSGNDYDFYIMDGGLTVIFDASTDVQDGDDDPYEQSGQTFSGERVVVAQFSGAGRFLHLNINRGALSVQTAGQTHGHSAAAAAFSVAATPAAAALIGPDDGPYPGFFTTANKVEQFSSDGPRRLFFDADGNEITPGNVSSTGGLLRQKPDLAAADGVEVTGVGGFGSPFYGTSAAAPHAAAIAALLKQARPLATPAQIRTWLTSSALDIEAAGVDRDSGAGIVMPVAALVAAGVTGNPILTVDTATVAENPGNGDGVLYGGEGGRITIALTNAGFSTAAAVSATLTTTTPGVTITSPAIRSYADMPASATHSPAVPFTFTLPSNALCGLTVDFRLTVTYTGAGSPVVLNVPYQIGVVEITQTFDGTAPVATPFYGATAGTQSMSLTRNSVASTCGAPAKTFPGEVVASPPIGYESYAFATCAATYTTCAQVSLAAPSGSGQQLFASTYNSSFIPSSLSSGYAGDLGQTHTDGAFAGYGVMLGPGAQTVIVNVSEIAPGAATGATYRMRVAGMCLASCTRNQIPVASVHDVTLPALGGFASGTIDNGSLDPDGDPVTISLSPAGPYALGTRTVLLTISDDKGATSQASAILTVVPAVTVTALSVSDGPALGGTVVTITGTNFSTTPGGTQVAFGGVASSSVICASSTSCVALSPAGSGVVSVRVTASGVTSPDTAADDFTYHAAPTVTSVTPSRGAIAGGAIVAITGTGFSTTAGATTVLFGGAAATNISCASTTACVATSPAGTGSISVRASVEGQTSADTAADDFVYATQVYLLAEGATGAFFDTDVLIANPNSVATPVTTAFYTEGGVTITDTRTIAAQSRTTLHVDSIPGLEATSVAAVVTSELGLPLAVERSMFWDASYYAGHTGPALAAAAAQWYFAEGAQGFFDTFVLVNNPNSSPTDVTFTFLREAEAPVVRTVTVAATSRYTLGTSSVPELADRAFAIMITATQPVTADRSMYFGSTPSQPFGGGMAAPGMALSSTWHFAEGATGTFFDTFFLLGNPQSTDAQVTLSYLLDSGEVITSTVTIPARGRLTINPEAGADVRLRSALFSTSVSADVAIIAERSMYWAGKATPWGEGHTSPGVTAPALAWDLAEGRAGGEHDFHTYILVANPQATPANVTVTYLRETGAPVVRTYVAPATGRLTIDPFEVPELANQSFGARVTVTNNMPVIVERSMYWSANGIFWSGGSSGTGIRVP